VRRSVGFDCLDDLLGSVALVSPFTSTLGGKSIFCVWTFSSLSGVGDGALDNASFLIVIGEAIVISPSFNSDPPWQTFFTSFTSTTDFRERGVGFSISITSDPGPCFSRSLNFGVIAFSSSSFEGNRLDLATSSFSPPFLGDEMKEEKDVRMRGLKPTWPLSPGDPLLSAQVFFLFSTKLFDSSSLHIFGLIHIFVANGDASVILFAATSNFFSGVLVFDVNGVTAASSVIRVATADILSGVFVFEANGVISMDLAVAAAIIFSGVFLPSKRFFGLKSNVGE